MEQELLSLFGAPEAIPVFSVVCVAQFLDICFVILFWFLFATVLSVNRQIMASDYIFYIFKISLQNKHLSEKI